MKVAIVLAIGALLPFTSAPTAAASAAESFTGRCSLTGTVTFDPPLGAVTQPGTATAVLAGECSGRLTDAAGAVRRLVRAPVSYRAVATGNGSCAGGRTTGAGHLDLGIPGVPSSTARIDFRFDETRAAAVALIRLHGAAGGSAAGVAYTRPDTDAVALVSRCVSGGLSAIPVDATLVVPSGLSG